LSSIIAAIDNLVDFKSTTRECYVSTSFNSKVNDKEEKKKSGRGTSKVVMDKDKTKLMGAQGKSTKPKFNSSFVMVLTLLENVQKGIN
jgi:hypothetical protein